MAIKEIENLDETTLCSDCLDIVLDFFRTNDFDPLDENEESYAENNESVAGQDLVPIESRYFSGFFVLSVQVLVPSRGQELVPIAVMDKNMSRFPIR
ncbi:hypothetical protein [Paenibacillus lautus]|uniref:hypothetical protein n=1 Tax=Paenibacillus lautus TaxID=1401 RepID=UPI003D2C7949